MAPRFQGVTLGDGTGRLRPLSVTGGLIVPQPPFPTSLHPPLVSLLGPASVNARGEYAGAAGVAGPRGARKRMWDRTYKSTHHAKSRMGIQSKGSIIHICERTRRLCCPGA